MNENVRPPVEIQRRAGAKRRHRIARYGNLGQLPDFLTRLVDRPAVDRTGISGAFDLRLLCALGRRRQPGRDHDVDHVEKPTEN